MTTEHEGLRAEARLRIVEEELRFGVYETTETFRSVPQHACVCRPDLELVAVTGPAGDPESEAWAELFSHAPAMLRMLKRAWSVLDEQVSKDGRVGRHVAQLHEDLGRLVREVKGLEHPEQTRERLENERRFYVGWDGQEYEEQR